MSLTTFEYIVLGVIVGEAGWHVLLHRVLNRWRWWTKYTKEQL